MKFKIYSKPDCSSCIAAKAFCEANGIPYEYLVLGVHFDFSDMMKISRTHRSFPLITLVNESGEGYIGTYQHMTDFFVAKQWLDQP